MAISLELGDARETARAQTMMRLVRYQQQRLAAAQRWLERALVGWRALADPTFVPQITLMLTWLALDRCDWRLARRHAHAGLTLPPELTSPRVALAFLGACAELADAKGHAERAGRLRATVHVLSQHYGPPFALLARLRAHSVRKSAGSAVDASTRVIDGEGILSLRDAIAFAVADGESPTHPTQAALSAREREVVQLVAEGGTNREIADQLCISERTIERHLSNIFDKLEVRSRGHVTRWAVNNSLLLA
jgi:DNA-binding CsgD family transcriptional regulator